MATKRLPHNSCSRIFPEQMGKYRVDVSRLQWQRSGNYCIHLSWKWSLQTHLVLVLPWFLRLRGAQTPVRIWVVAWKMRVHTRLTCGGSVSDGSVRHYKYSHLHAVMWCPNSPFLSLLERITITPTITTAVTNFCCCPLHFWEESQVLKLGIEALLVGVASCLSTSAWKLTCCVKIWQHRPQNALWCKAWGRGAQGTNCIFSHLFPT